MNNITSHYNANGYSLDKCNICPVRNLSFCNVFDDCALEKFSALAKTRSYTDGQLVLTEGEDNEYIGSITEGIVKVYKLLNDGRQQIISLGFPGDMLGNISDTEYNYFVEAVGKVKICLYRVSRIASFADTNPEIYLSLLGKTNEQLSHARDWLVLLGRKTAKEKIASFLLLLSEHHQGSETDQAFKIPLKRQEIADFLGLTIETVSRNFSNLKNQQLIREQAGHMLIIVNYTELKNIS